jgi:hypothetical protein
MRHRINVSDRHRKWSPEFISLLDSIQGLIRWPLQEMSGDVALARNFGVSGLDDSSQYPGPQLLVDGDMEAETTVAWTSNSGATLTKETASPYTGTRYLRVQSTGGDSASQARQDVLTAGVRAIVDGWYRTESGGTAQVIIGLGGANALTFHLRAYPLTRFVCSERRGLINMPNSMMFAPEMPIH